MKCSSLFRMLFLGLVLFASPLYAQPVSFQGRLTDADGQPVSDGSYQLTLLLYEQATGGTAVFEETHTVETRGGIFSLLMGTQQALDPALFGKGTPYLALVLDGEELQPRTPLSATPYALHAGSLEGGALVAGANVTITEQSDGALRIDAVGGDGSGLTAVATDATLEGDGRADTPLGLAEGSVTEAKLADGSVKTAKLGDGSVREAKLADGSVKTAKLADGSVLTAKLADGSVLTAKLGDGAVTGAKLAEGALVAGANVTIQRQEDGTFEITSTGGGLSQVQHDATLSGEGTMGNPLQVAAPLSLTGSGQRNIVIRGAHSNGHVGSLGSDNYGASGTHSNGNYGILGHTDYGIYGESTFGPFGGLGFGSAGAVGVFPNGNHMGFLGAPSAGVYGQSESGYAGTFIGNVQVRGHLSKFSGSFKIDHPLDPAGQYLSHSFVESPDMMNVYNGNVITDANGEAVVTLPDYFEALNRDFRYQLTCIGQFAQAIVAEEIDSNRFVIRTDVPNVKVSWQVTGIRQDAWANENRIVVEEEKPTEERGFYLHPRLYGQPAEQSVEWAQHPEMMREIQEMPQRLKTQRQQMDAERARREQQ